MLAQVYHYDVVSDRKRYTYDRKRAVNDSVGFRSITVASRRVVYDEIRISFTPEICRKTVVFPTNQTVYATFTTASRRNSPYREIEREREKRGERRQKREVSREKTQKNGERRAERRLGVTTIASSQLRRNYEKLRHNCA